MYLDLLNDGYNDIKFVGVNGYDYISNDYHCMICDTPDSCSNCEDIRILPWVQDVQGFFVDYSSQIECEENGFDWTIGEQISHDSMDQTTCEANGYFWFHNECIEYVYGCIEEVEEIWDSWDITLRDLVIVNRQGYEVARLNLTYTNPDPESTCGENYQTIKELIIDAR